jgi:hypothetical protein
MFRFSIRDLLWLIAVVALGVAWWIDRRQLALDLERRLTVNVEGVVIQTDDAQGLIEVSMGSDDGVKLRDPLEVSRGSQWRGRAVVQTVAPNRAVARVEMIQGVIQKGDRVSFKFDTSRIPESTPSPLDQVLDRRHP